MKKAGLLATGFGLTALTIAGTAAVRNIIYMDMQDNTKEMTNYDANIAQLKSQLTVDEFNKTDSILNSLPSKRPIIAPGIEVIEATQEVAQALKGAPKDSVPARLGRALASLVQKVR